MGKRTAAGSILVATWVVLITPALAADSEIEQRRVAETGLISGMVLDRKTASLAADLLPAEILAHYQKDEYRNELVDWPLGRSSLGDDFAARTRWNSENLTVDEEGTIIEKASGKQPSFGFQDRSWTGVAWAPVAHKLARRKVWVIEW